MTDELVEKMKNLTIVLVIAIALFGIVNTLFLVSRIGKLENKIEHIKIFKSE